MSETETSDEDHLPKSLISGWSEVAALSQSSMVEGIIGQESQVEVKAKRTRRRGRGNRLMRQSKRDTW